jgi:hypothetical protein
MDVDFQGRMQRAALAILGGFVVFLRHPASTALPTPNPTRKDTPDLPYPAYLLRPRQHQECGLSC